MPTTPNYSLHFPSLSDLPNVPADNELLAEGVDTELARIDALLGGGTMQRGAGDMGPATNISSGEDAPPVAVTFPTPFATVPYVLFSTNQGSNYGGKRFIVFITQVTTTGFNVRATNIWSGAQSFTSMPFVWLAIEGG